MAVGSGELGEILDVAGVRVATVSAGIKTPGRRDVVVFELAEGSSVAGTFTKNAFCAAPVVIAKQHLSVVVPRYWLVNTGNANAGTGDAGMQHARYSCERLAELCDVAPSKVLPFSTGVIGEPLPVDKIVDVLPEAIAALSESGWLAAASGIMTTDTRPKAASRRVELGGVPITITGIAKGAGMIKPNMATMLGYVATDLEVSEHDLQDMHTRAVNMSFNRITVDGDTSTNDACVVAASGKGGASWSALDFGAQQLFWDAFLSVYIELAHGLVRDGEGASKFVAVRVEEGNNVDECLKVAYTIAESPLVKTALFASDPNWGRLLAAIGRAGLDDLDVSKVSVYLNGVLIAEYGGRAASYTEELGQQAMAKEDIEIIVRLGRGDAVDTVWTTDLSYDYVKINAEYRT